MLGAKLYTLNYYWRLSFRNHNDQLSLLFLILFSLGDPRVTCPTEPPSTQSQIDFESPSLENFPSNGAFTFLTYMFNNLDANPQVVNERLTTIPASVQNHVLSNLPLGNNQIMISAADSTTNPPTTASCTFNFRRTGESTKM